MITWDFFIVKVFFVKDFAIFVFFEICIQINNLLYVKYSQEIDRESAYEILEKKVLAQEEALALEKEEKEADISISNALMPSPERSSGVTLW